MPRFVMESENLNDGLEKVKAQQAFCVVFFIGGITGTSDQAIGITKMEARLGSSDSMQDRRSDGGSGIDMKLLWKNRRKDAHQSQNDAFPEARFISFAADKAGSNYDE